MIPFRKSLGFRVLALSFILLALPLLVDTIYFFYARLRMSLENAKKTIVDLSRDREPPLAQLFPPDNPILPIMEEILNLRGNFPKEPNEEINGKLTEFAKIGSYSSIDLLKVTEEGQFVVVASTLPTYIGQDQTAFYQSLSIPTNIEHEKDINLIYLDQDDNYYYINGYPIIKDNKLIGILSLYSNITDRLTELLIPKFANYTLFYAVLLSNSMVIAATDPAFVFQFFSPLSPEARKAILAQDYFADRKLPEEPLPVAKESSYPFIEFTWKGREHIGYFRKIGYTDFFLLTCAAKEEIFVAPLFDLLRSYSFYALILIFGSLLSFLVVKRMALPLANLSTTMTEIEKGDTSRRYTSDPLGFEINVLGETFNEMVTTLIAKKNEEENERVGRELYSKELQLGEEAQKALLIHKEVTYPGVDIAMRYIPARQVGGDFFDVFEKEEKGIKELVVTIADASGKGVEACFYSLIVRGLNRIFVKEKKLLSSALQETNHLFVQDTAETGAFVTLLTGIYNAQTGKFIFSSAGHNPPLLRRREGEVVFLECIGMALGIHEKAEYRTKEVELFEGDEILFYTDGVTEAHDENFRLFSEERLKELFVQGQSKSASSRIDQILKEVEQFVGTSPQHDDITILVMKIGRREDV